MEQIEVPLDCPICESLKVKASLVKYGEKYGLGVLCLDCGAMNILEFEVLKEILNKREMKK